MNQAPDGLNDGGLVKDAGIEVACKDVNAEFCLLDHSGGDHAMLS
jgi:hypothetical protein